MRRPAPEPTIDSKVPRTKRAALEEAYARAAKDPAFLEEAGALSSEFTTTDRDGL